MTEFSQGNKKEVGPRPIINVLDFRPLGLRDVYALGYSN
jgi:hypothetical protein